MQRNRAPGDACARSSPSTSSITRAIAASGLSSTRESGDVGVIQGSEQFRFTLKAGEPLLVGREGRRQGLDSNLPLQLRVGRAVDLAHSAGADGGDTS